MKYNIKIAAFEGPMELLLHLIEKNKIDIYDIPMAELTQQYMEYIEESREFNVEIATEFLLMASTLLQIKSRTILPTLEKVTYSETESTIDPREELVQRILEYKRFQKVSELLTKMLSKEESFIKRAPMKLSKKVLPPENLSPEKLLKAFVSAIAIDNENSIPQTLISSEVFHVRDKIVEILSMLSTSDIKLSEITKTQNIGEMIASFLALLELVRRQQVSVKQLIPFGEILVSKIK